MRLILMRHAEAGEADPARWPDDRDRPLTEAGRREHAVVATGLHRMGLRFDRLLASPLVRARETAEITARAYGGSPAPEVTELLGARAQPASTLVGLAAVEADTLLAVGHEPTLSGLVALLIDRDGRARVEMAKSGVAVIECARRVAPGGGLLRLHLRPEELLRLLDSPEAPGGGPSPDAFMGGMTAYQRSAALKAAIDLDLFTAVGAAGGSAETMAGRCGASARGIRALCDYLTADGFLQKSGARYALTVDSAAFLDRRSPAYVGGAAEFLYAPEIREAFADVATAVRRGGTALGAGTTAPEHPVWVRFARAMAPLMRLPARAVVDLVAVDPARPLRVLDVAAGHGVFGIAFAQAYPRAEVTALDWPAVLEVARENARAAGIDGRFHLRPGSAFETALGGPYDLVLLPNFLHHFDPPTCERLIARLAAALAPGGRVITVEFVPDEGRVTPPRAAMFSLVMLCSTPAGDAYTFAELEAMFRRAGFPRSELRVPGPAGPQVIISQR